MNSRIRFSSILGFERTGRNLGWELGYWPETLERWYKEGLPRNSELPPDVVPGQIISGEALPHDPVSRPGMRDRDIHDTLSFDSGFIRLPINSGPQPLFEKVVFDETREFITIQDEYGIRKRLNKQSASIPEFIDWQVTDRRDFQRLKEERFQPTLDGRVPTDWSFRIEQFRRRDYPLAIGGYPCGFYGFLRLLLGEERLLFGFYDQTDLIRDMMSFLADFWISLWEEALAVIEVDCAHFWEDMAYRSGSLVSPAMFEEFIMPCYRRITDFLKSKGVRHILVDTDGNLDQLIPLFLASGVTGLYPFEVQAGNDLRAIRKAYPALQILGGVNKMVLREGKNRIDQELDVKVAPIIRSGGYIPFVDHAVPPDVSWDNFCYYRSRLDQLLNLSG